MNVVGNDLGSRSARRATITASVPGRIRCVGIAKPVVHYSDGDQLAAKAQVISSGPRV